MDRNTDAALAEQLRLQNWDRLEHDQAARVAEALAERLGPHARLVELNSGPGRHIATFESRHGIRMALVPGGLVRLGWEPCAVRNLDPLFRRDSHQLTQHPALMRSLEQMGLTPLPERPLPERADVWLEGLLTPPRSMLLQPLLVAVEGLDSQEVVERPTRGHPWNSIEGWLADRDARLPTSDEWEHLAGGGARTLFRWGDVWPDTPDFDQHRLPNGFGLRLTASAYQPECVRERDVMRGGDGGELVCAGVGPLAWVTFATSYVCRSEWIVRDPASWVEQAVVRPVMSLPLPPL